MIVGGYTMHLYCDGSPCKSGEAYQNEFYGETAGECRRDARRIGWRFDRMERKAYCPACKGNHK